MNYKKIYDSLIDRAKNRLLEGYCESHHVVPRCMGGTDEKDNLVKLTPEEHYVAHQLLVKIYPNNKKLIHAAVMMVSNRPSNKLYGWLKRKLSDIVSERQSKEGNSQFGTRWIHSKELQISKRIEKEELLPEGWFEGRVIDFQKKNERLQCLYCGKDTSIEFSKKTKFCSKQCKLYYKAPHYKYIDENEELLIQEFKQTNSINKVLHKHGIEGRKGNLYLSTKIKSHGIEVKARGKYIKYFGD